MLWLLFKIYYIMINDHVHCFDNQSIYEWETDLPAVMNWIVKKALTMMISFKICLRIMLQFCFLFNQDQKKKKVIYFVVTSIRQVSLEELIYKSKSIDGFFLLYHVYMTSQLQYQDIQLVFLTSYMGECHQLSPLFASRFLEWEWWPV